MRKLYRIHLTCEERVELENIVSRGVSAAHKQRHARILLKADENHPEGRKQDQEIAAAVEVDRRTVERVRQLFVEEGLDRALEAKRPARDYRRKLDGKAEAHLVALACGKPPEGARRWTLRLLADRLVELEVTESICLATLSRTLKKMNLNLGSGSIGA